MPLWLEPSVVIAMFKCLISLIMFHSPHVTLNSVLENLASEVKRLACTDSSTRTRSMKLWSSRTLCLAKDVWLEMYIHCFISTYSTYWYILYTTLIFIFYIFSTYIYILHTFWFSMIFPWEASGNGLFALEVWCRPYHQGQSLGSKDSLYRPYHHFECETCRGHDYVWPRLWFDCIWPSFQDEVTRGGWDDVEMSCKPCLDCLDVDSFYFLFRLFSLVSACLSMANSYK